MKQIIKRLSQKIKKLNEARNEYKKRHKHLPKSKNTQSNLPPSQSMTLDVSVSTLVKILVVISIFIALKNIFVELQSIIVISAIAFFMAMALSPVVSALERYHVPRPLAILLIYFIFFTVLGVLFVGVIPIIAEQLLDLAYDLKAYISAGNISDWPWLDSVLVKLQFDATKIQAFISDNLASISSNLQSVAGSTFLIFTNIFQGVFNFIYALVLMFFILLEREKIAGSILLMFPVTSRRYIEDKFSSIQEKLSEWFRGQFILMLSMGSFIYVGMKILEVTMDMKYAATIGLLAGVMELFPFIGVFLTGVMSLLVAINISWTLVIAILILIAVSQFLEGNILVPMVMGRTVGLSSVVTLLALSIGGVLGSAIGGVPLAIIGMIFAIPVAASISIFVEEYLHRGN